MIFVDIVVRIFVDIVITKNIKLDPKSWIIFKKYDVKAVSPKAIFENQRPVNNVYRRIIGAVWDISKNRPIN